MTSVVGAPPVTLSEAARMDLRTSRSGDTATASLQRALGLQYRYQVARLAIGRSLGLATAPTRVENLDGKAIRGETLFGVTPEEIGLWLSLLTTRRPDAMASRRNLQEAIADHWARGAGLLWDSLRDAEDAPAALAAQMMRAK